jgi:Tfp pilus assembly protein PilW
MSRRGGLTLIELLAVALMTFFVLGGAILVLAEAGRGPLLQHGAQMDAQVTAQRAIDRVSAELRQAMGATADCSLPTQLSFVLPNQTVQADGTILVDEANPRQIVYRFQGSQLIRSQNGVDDPSPVATNLATPGDGDACNGVFTACNGDVVTLCVTAQAPTTRGQQAMSQTLTSQVWLRGGGA